MKVFLGIDTSNYTTSFAAYCEDGRMLSEKKLLPVAEGQKGLRQNDAIFLHVKQFPEVAERLFSRLPSDAKIAGVAVSSRPRDVEGSYMPCFLVGRTIAHTLATEHNLPLREVSHQSGHIAAALFGADRLDLLASDFVSFHVSGGTTEGLYISAKKQGFDTKIVSKTLDISAGQLIDRIGVSLGMKFPAGPELEKLALAYSGEISAKPVIKGTDCCLSGVENVCSRLLDEGMSKEYVAAYCFGYIAEMLVRISLKLKEEYGDIPFLYAGGVMSSSFMREYISSRVSGAVFTKPEYSSDNAAGVAYLSAALSLTI